MCVSLKNIFRMLGERAACSRWRGGVTEEGLRTSCPEGAVQKQGSPTRLCGPVARLATSRTALVEPENLFLPDGSK